MKKLVTRILHVILMAALLAGVSQPASAQLFTRTDLETGGLYTALTKDGSGNLYVTRVQPGTGGANYEVEKYTNAMGTPAVIYTGLTHAIEEYPWGLAVTSTGDVYISTDFTTNAGAIIKLTNNSGTYTPSTFQTGRYFTALAVDATDNLYASEYNVAHSSYSVVKYAANSAAFSAGTRLHDYFTAGPGYAYPTGLAVAANGDVYVTDAFSNDPTITFGGRLYKLTAASAYALTTIATNGYISSLAFDAAGNLFASQRTGATYTLAEYPAAGGAAVNVFGPMNTNGIFYPWGIAVMNSDKIFAIDGDDGTLGGAVMDLTSSQAFLSNLAVSSGSLNPAFVKNTLIYNVSVANNVTSVTCTPTVPDNLETIQVNSKTVVSGTPSGSIPLLVGANNIFVVVTAPDGITKKTYKVTVTRAASADADLANLVVSHGVLTPSFSPATTTYTDNVGNGTTSVTVTPTTDNSEASVTINGYPIPSGTASPAFSLNVGPNTITTVVTAGNGTTKTYTLTVTRAASANANLANLQTNHGILTPSFSAATTTYTDNVGYGTTSFTVTPTTANSEASVTVNGNPVPSGTASSALPLAVGPNTITTVVTAGNGTTKTYTLTVTRASAPTVANNLFPTTVAGNQDEGIAIRQGVSPNGDGANDILKIDGITNYPDNKLSIMNRSGILVYEAKGYNNITKVFDGHSSKTGKLQQPGTYFYSLEYKAGGVTKRKTGFIVLKY